MDTSKRSSRRLEDTQHVHVREEKGAVVCRDVVDGKQNKIELAIALRTHPLEIEVCERSALSGF